MEKGGKPDRKPYPFSSVKKSIQKYVLLPQPNVVQLKIFDWAALLVHK
jgi:hypothetical protein